MSIGKIILIALVAVIAAIGLTVAFASPPWVLNTINTYYPGDANAEEVAKGVSFGPDANNKLDVWAPKDRATTGPLPVVIFYYGGGWVKGSRQEYGFAGRAFAAQGFVAVVPNYRLVPGVRFPAFMQDSALAVKWARDHVAEFGGDPKRISVSGHSAGAYNAAMLALDTHWLRDIGVDPAIIRSAAPMSGPYDFYPFEKRRSRDAFGQWPRPRETQPIAFARKGAPPMLLMQGTIDDTVRAYNAQHLAKALRDIGAPVVLKLYPGQGHNDLIMGISKPFRFKSTTLADSTQFMKANSR